MSVDRSSINSIVIARRFSSDMERKRYIGSIPHLQGKTALVKPTASDAGEVMAQFEEHHLQESRDWWQFSERDFDAID